MAGKLKERTEKLPLTARKNIRDEWEAKKGDFESQISDILGEKWTIETDVNLIYSYASEDYAPRLGATIVWYIEPFVYNLKNFIGTFGDDGKQELNNTCSEHKLIFGPQEKTTFNYGGLVVEDGALKLVFADGAYPVNVDDVSKDFGGALATAAASNSGSSAFNIVARNAVRQEYDPKITEVHSKIKTALNMPDLKLNPNFEANSAELAKSTQEDWQKRIGFITLAYFEGLAYALERHNFKGDDMLQEGFQEAVEKNEVCFRLFQKWSDDNFRYNEVVVEDGILYLQTIVDYFGSNTDDVAMKILDIL